MSPATRGGHVAHKEACPKTFSPTFWCHLKVVALAEEAAVINMSGGGGRWMAD